MVQSSNTSFGDEHTAKSKAFQQNRLDYVAAIPSLKLSILAIDRHISVAPGPQTARMHATCHSNTWLLPNSHNVNSSYRSATDPWQQSSISSFRAAITIRLLGCVGLAQMASLIILSEPQVPCRSSLSNQHQCCTVIMDHCTAMQYLRPHSPMPPYGFSHGYPVSHTP